MRLLALNASPRGQHSNSALILDWILQGWEEAGGTAALRLKLTEGQAPVLEGLAQVQAVLIVFPLYTDFVPGMLKELFDSLALLPREALEGKTLACVVHSGFPESIQSEPVQAWLERVAERLGFDFAGCLIKAGSEGFRMMPAQMTAGTATRFRDAGAGLARTGSFPEGIRASLASPRTLGPLGRLAFRIMGLLGLANFYWNGQLMKHGAFLRRFDAPYGPRA